jgi:hypothetical protein
MTQYAQLFCSVADLVADKQSPGIDEAQMFKAIQQASDFVQKEIGWFLPVTLTRSLHGHGSYKLFVPPLLSITSIVNWAGTTSPVTLSASDYLLIPNNGFWANGPFTEIIVNPFATLLRSWCDLQNGVEIAGRWGMYERSGDTGATVQDDPQSSGSGTLKVSDGGKVSPGMVLLIGSEQEAVTGWSLPTTGVTAINMVAGLTASDDVMTVDDASLLHIGEIARAGFEQMKIKDIQGNDCELIRSWNGTRNVAHANDLAIDVYRTVTAERGVNGTTAASHAKTTAISRYFVPDDVLYLTKEIATLSANKALGGYQGRTGNAETGAVFYNDASPRFDIETVKSNYRIPRLG